MASEALELVRLAVAALEGKKAYHMLALDVSTRTSITDTFLICSVGSPRHAQAVADEIHRTLAARGERALSLEGYDQGSWILMDYGELVLHIFLEERREYFALERLWGDAPEITARVRPTAP